MKTILLLIASNIFMTFAWYGHLKTESVPVDYFDSRLWRVILMSWGIAFFEYMLMIPANRLGILQFSAFQLKIIQEVITLVVFTIFSVFYLRQNLEWNQLLSFFFILLAVYFGFKS